MKNIINKQIQNLNHLYESDQLFQNHYDYCRVIVQKLATDFIDKQQYLPLLQFAEFKFAETIFSDYLPKINSRRNILNSNVVGKHIGMTIRRLHGNTKTCYFDKSQAYDHLSSEHIPLIDDPLKKACLAEVLKFKNILHTNFQADTTQYIIPSSKKPLLINMFINQLPVYRFLQPLGLQKTKINYYIGSFEVNNWFWQVTLSYNRSLNVDFQLHIPNKITWNNATFNFDSFYYNNKATNTFQILKFHLLPNNLLIHSFKNDITNLKHIVQIEGEYDTGVSFLPENLETMVKDGFEKIIPHIDRYNIIPKAANYILQKYLKLKILTGNF